MIKKKKKEEESDERVEKSGPAESGSAVRSWTAGSPAASVEWGAA